MLESDWIRADWQWS